MGKCYICGHELLEEELNQPVPIYSARKGESRYDIVYSNFRIHGYHVCKKCRTIRDTYPIAIPVIGFVLFLVIGLVVRHDAITAYYSVFF